MTFNHGVRGSIPRWVTIFLFEGILESHRGVAQLGARVLWEHEVAGSIPVTPTKKLVPFDRNFFFRDYSILYDK